MNLRNILVLFVISASLSTGTAVYGRGGGGGHGGGGSVSGSSGGGGGRSASSAGGVRSAGMRGGMRGSAYRPMAAGGRYPVYGGQAIRSGMTRQQFVRSQSGSHHVARTSTGQRQFSGEKKLARAGQNQTTQVSGANQRMNRQSNEALLGRVQSGNRKSLTTRDGSVHKGNWSRNNPKNQQRFGPRTQERLRNWEGKPSTVAEAHRRNQDLNGGHGQHGNHNHNGHHHNHDWWHHHCDAIIFWDLGWWGWWDGWWYPAWGYDPYYQSYEYDGPIYGYDGLPPDEVVANVQSELQRLGYFTYAVDGKLGPLTRSAINRYQRDNRLPITGTIDPATAGALGLQ